MSEFDKGAVWAGSVEHREIYKLVDAGGYSGVRHFLECVTSHGAAWISGAVTAIEG